MKKFAVLFIVVIIVCVSIFVACSKPTKVYYPAQEDIISATVQLSGCEKDQIDIKKEDLEKFYSYLISSKPYSKSNSDEPVNAESYFTVRLATEKEIYTFYVFTKRTNTYIEKPYIGIYKTNIEAEDMFFKYFA